MKLDLFEQFSEFIDKQAILCKLTESQKLYTYRYSEIEIVITIGKLNNPNLTEIVKFVNMTKGAISKITKKLVSNGVIETYSLPNNRQKVFFKLTEKGEYLFREHEKKHSIWIQRDINFLRQFSNSDLEKIYSFMNLYNEYLEQKIQELNKNN